MARTRKNALPKYVELNPRNRTYYYKNPAMPGKARSNRKPFDSLPSSMLAIESNASGTPRVWKRRSILGASAFRKPSAHLLRSTYWWISLASGQSGG